MKLRALLLVHSILACSLAATAQEMYQRQITATIRVDVANIAGNNLGSFGCQNIRVGSSKAQGDIKKGICMYVGTFATKVLNAKPSLSVWFAKPCDQKVFKSVLVSEGKWGNRYVYDWEITSIRCEVVK